MLSEEALIVLAAFGACGLLALGVLELLWPTRPRHAVRYSPTLHTTPLHARRPHRQSALARHARDKGRVAYGRREAPLARSPVTPTRIGPAPPIASPPVPASPFAASAPTPSPTSPAPEPSSPPTAPEPVVVLATTPARPVEEDSIVEACFALYQERRYAEVVERATGALTDGSGGALTGGQEIAALWSVVALAHQALGEDAKARTALEAAIASAPPADKPTYQGQLASLAEHVAQGLLAEAQRSPCPHSEDALAAIRSAVAWLEQGAAAAPSDARLAELADTAQALLWPAWERTVMALVQRQEFRAARRLLREALSDPRFPSGRLDTFRELFSGTFSGEVGQLTAQAIRSMHEARETDALASLQRAETLLGTLPEGALPSTRREEVDRRLWWGYNRVGERLVEAGEHEDALEPLFHALGYDVGPERRQETVVLLLRALDRFIDGQAVAIHRLADTGDREAALVQCDRVWTRLRNAAEMGLSSAELTAPLAKVLRLFETLGRVDSDGQGADDVAAEANAEAGTLGRQHGAVDELERLLEQVVQQRILATRELQGGDAWRGHRQMQAGREQHRAAP